MPRRVYLGELELMVLLTLIRLGEESYGVPISRELAVTAGRELAVGSLYAALDRLEEKGLVRSRTGDPTPERGGRGKRMFHVTAKGLQQVRMTRAALSRLWSGVPKLEVKPV